MWHARRAWPLPFKVRVRRLAGRFRLALGAGLLLAAVGASATPAELVLAGKSLPISVASTIRSIHPSKCTLNASGTQAIVTGAFNPPASLPVVNGQQVGALQLQLRVVTSQNMLGAHDVAVGESYEGVSVGQTTWHLMTPVERVHGLRPTRCVVAYGVFGIG